ncbi:MAG: division/cell wall cluster transcriptional repressor MraZ [Actinomycetaceae bacterium]|nr:division/cell wall cluster transcriptional repressor MraZ [Actinomycetaceae bacterium]MDY6083029.1 division/cell wall cluster transcriptional repressor MraZ [Actinomycetaceae bacterium]
MFLGTFEPKLDAKGRFILPSRFRDDLQAGLVMTRGKEHCVDVFSASEFESMRQKLVARSSESSKITRGSYRVFFSGANPQIPDKQGRVVVPQNLRHYAMLDKELAVIGAGDRVEIWDLARWNAYLDEYEASFADEESDIVPGLF